MGDNVKVVIRIRPLNSREVQEGARRCLAAQIERSAITLEAKPKPKTYTYDFVADEDISQDEIFQVVGKPITTSCMSGYNGTVFAYGQTGAGKTHTILGPEVCSEGSPQYEERGLLPRCIEFLFASINREMRRCEGLEFLVKCSFIEIYNEQVIDLLSATQTPLSIREDLKLGVYVENLTELAATSAPDTYIIMKQGTQRRHTGATQMNKESSRSHSVFTMLIESREAKQGLQNFRSSRFHLIDLAGSERQKSTEAAGTRLKEAGMINKSLSALGSVINALVDISEGRSRHVHYRDSKLTFLLKDSLGGNSKTCIVAAISPAASGYGETLSTLKFAQRAKMIRNKAVVNEDSSIDVKALKEQVKQLKEQLKQTQGSKPSDYTLITMNSRVGELESLLESNLKLRQEVEVALQNELESKDALIVQLSETVGKFERKLANEKMILKMKEAAITRLQQGMSPEVQALYQEIEMLRESVEMPPIAAKLLAENEHLKGYIENLQRELSFDPYSLRYRLRENQEFTSRLAVSLQESSIERAQLKPLLDELACYKSGELISSPVKRKFEAELSGHRSRRSASLLDPADLQPSERLKSLEMENSRLNSLIEENSFRLNRSQNESECSFNDSIGGLNTSRAVKLALQDAARASTLETELESCRIDLETRELEIQDLTEQLETIMAAYEYLKDQLKTSKASCPRVEEPEGLSDECTYLASQVRAKEEIERDLRLYVKELEAQLEASVKPATRYSSEDLEYYKLEYQTLLVESDSVKTENAELIGKLMKLEKRLSDAEVRERSYKVEMQKLAEDIDSETRKLTTELTEAYEALINVKTESEATISACKAEYDALKGLASQADLERSSAIEQLQVLQRVQKKEVEDAKAQVSDLKTALEQKTKQVESLANHEASLRSQLTRLTEKLTVMTQSETTCIESQKQLTSLKREIEKSHEENAQLKDYLTAFEERFKDATTKEVLARKAFETEKAHMLESQKLEIVELERKLMSSHAEVQTLTDANTALLKRIESFETDNSEVKQKFVESLSNREQVLQQLAQLREQEYQKSLLSCELKGKLEAVTLKNSQLMKELEQLNKENERLGGHANLSQKIKLHSKLKEENNKLKTVNFKLTEDLRKTKLKLDAVTKRYQDTVKREGFTDADLSEEVRLRRELEDLTEELSRVKQSFSIIYAELSDFGATMSGDESCVGRTVEAVQLIRRQLQSATEELAEKNTTIGNLNSELKIFSTELSLQDFKETIATRTPLGEASNRTD